MTPTPSPTPDVRVSSMVVPAQPPPRQSLTRAECLALLAPGGHGRVAATTRAVPIIIPVAFTLVGEVLVFTPGSGEVLSRTVENSVVAFETDQRGSDGHAAWEVHVTGVATTLTDNANAPGFRLSSEIMTGWVATA